MTPPTITLVGLRNVKGITADFKLAPFTVICGRNHAGKTAILDAITIGINGYHPRLGKTGPATFQIASGKTMDITVAGEGWMTYREWTKTGKSVKTLPASTSGEMPAIQVGTLDPEAFIGASAKQRLQMMAELIGDTAQLELQAKLPQWSKTLGPVPTGTAAEQAESYELLAAENLRNCRATVERLTKAKQTQADLGDEDPAYAVITLNGIIADLEKELDAAKAAEREASGRARSLERADEDADDCANELSLLNPDDMPLESSKEKLEAILEARKSEWQAVNAARFEVSQRLVSYVAPAYGARRQLEREGYGRVTTAEQARMTAEGIKSVLSGIGDTNYEGLDEARRKATKLQDELADARAKYAGVIADQQTIGAKIADIEHLEACPTCRASAPGWRDAVLATLKAEYTDLEQRHKERLMERERILNLATEALCEVDRLETARINSGKKDNLERNLERAIDLANWSEKAEQEQKLNKELEVKLTEAGDAYRAAQEMLDSYTAKRETYLRIESLKAIVAGKPAPGAVEAAISEADRRASEVGRIDQRLKDQRLQLAEANRLEGQKKLLEATNNELANAEEALAAAATLAAEIREARMKALAGAYDPILDLARELGSGVIEGTIAVSDDEIGIARGTSFIPWGAMSGTERVVISAAISAALSARCGGLVLLDEMSRVDRANRVRFSANLVAAVKAGRIRQVVLIDHDSAAWDGMNDEWSCRIDI